MFYRIHSLRWKFSLPLLLVMLLTIGLLLLFLLYWADHYYIATLRTQLHQEAKLVTRIIAPQLANDTNLDITAREISDDLNCRVTIILPNGKVAGDSAHDSSSMDLHNTRPEVLAAMRTGQGSSIRYSATLRHRMMYVSQRISINGNIIGITRLAVSLSDVDAARGAITRALLVAALFSALFSIVLGVILSGYLARPLQAMTSAARKISQGDFNINIPLRHRHHDEIDELSTAMNRMSADLRLMLAQQNAEQRKLEAILNNTQDGLMLVDKDATVQLVNPSAIRLLEIDSPQVLHLSVIAATHQLALAELTDRVLRLNSPAALEIVVNRTVPRWLNVDIYPLENVNGELNALIALHDITIARHTENLRRDFVANVSHELRTPMASVRAMAETIILHSQKMPGTAEEFAQQIIVEIDRLTALSDDLLQLATIEAEGNLLQMADVKLQEFIENIVVRMQVIAEQKGIVIAVQIPDQLAAFADRNALEQVVINLLDNAIKYTPQSGKVSISAYRQDSRVIIAIVDSGIGIPAGDITRIFERFYRVDKARSRLSGGTGLGLAIVKHLLEAQGGTITVESVLQQGSTFKFSLLESIK